MNFGKIEISNRKILRKNKPKPFPQKNGTKKCLYMYIISTIYIPTYLMYVFLYLCTKTSNTGHPL